MGHTRREHEQGTGLQLMAALAGRDLNVAGQGMDRVSCPPVAGGLTVTTEPLRGTLVSVG